MSECPTCGQKYDQGVGNMQLETQTLMCYRVNLLDDVMVRLKNE